MKSLAILTALAVAAAQFPSSLPARQVVTASTYQTLLKYVYFTGASTHQPCNKPPYGAVTVRDFNVTSTDTQGSIYRLDKTSELIIAFPGTNGTRDIATDLTPFLVPYNGAGCGASCRVHDGFQKAWDSISPLMDATMAAQVQKYPSYTISITGGSLGGALAKLAFLYFKAKPLYQNKVTVGWSYGEPRVGNGPFADYTDKLAGADDSTVGIWHRVTHQNDPVPRILPTFSGYKHSRTEFWEMDNAAGVPDAAHTYRCYGQEPSDCNNGQPTFDANAHTTYAGYNVTVCQ